MAQNLTWSKGVGCRSRNQVILGHVSDLSSPGKFVKQWLEGECLFPKDCGWLLVSTKGTARNLSRCIDKVKRALLLKCLSSWLHFPCYTIAWFMLELHLSYDASGYP